MLSPMSKILTVRLPDDAAQYLADCAAASRLSVNRTIEAIIRAAQDSGWSEVSLVPTIRRPSDE